MNRSMLLLFLIFVFLGCSTKKSSFVMSDHFVKENLNIESFSDTLNLKFYFAEATGYFGWGGTSDEEFIEFLIKNIANKTLDSGKKYFIIISPREVSNYEGRVINTIKGFQENINYVRSTNRFHCSETLYCMSLKIELVFAMLDEKSMDYIVWDAKKILVN